MRVSIHSSWHWCAISVGNPSGCQWLPPLRARQSLLKEDLTEAPRGVTRPTPVTTTRWRMGGGALPVLLRAAPPPMYLYVFADEGEGVTVFIDFRVYS